MSLKIARRMNRRSRRRNLFYLLSAVVPPLTPSQSTRSFFFLPEKKFTGPNYLQGTTVGLKSGAVCGMSSPLVLESPVRSGYLVPMGAN